MYSPDPRECERDECVEALERRLDELRVEATSVPRLGDSKCEIRSFIEGEGTVAGSACRCDEASGSRSHFVGPRGAGCTVPSRGGGCLWEPAEVEPCDPADVAACEVVCAELEQRLVADAAHVFDAEILISRCSEGGSCESAF